MSTGTMISHWESVRYGAKSVLGVAAVLAALMAIVYTTASSALVTPVLQFGKHHHRLIYGKVSTSFANSGYIMDQCKTPISPSIDPDNSGQTCISIEHPGQAYHNYMQYLSTWVDNIDSGTGSGDLRYRPAPVGMVSSFSFCAFPIRQTNRPQDILREYIVCPNPCSGLCLQEDVLTPHDA